MTPTQLAQVAALARCTFSPGSWAKRFVRDMSSPTKATATLSERQAEALNGLAHSYRRQIGKCMAVACTTCGTPSENDDVPAGTVERFKAARVSLRYCHKFMALTRLGNGRVWEDDDDKTSPSVVGPVGGNSPTTFKLYRNARAAAGDEGFVVLFDPRMLPVVGEEATHAIDWANKLDEESFAERQLLYWERELQRIRARNP